ncbi:MAG: thiazole biosynthesis adenylyltransferase ThiF [Thermoprotei archaeon]|nr:MAG: thiazole biosynthesis adenylyltransferase ThiF [Thermoprotei archaeon]
MKTQLYTPEIIERFSRQILVEGIGASGLKKIREARVAVIGCGATGTSQAELLARLGVGFIRLVDKDFVDISNLPRTHLYTYSDAKQALPKAVACASKLKEIDPAIEVDPVITRVTPSNIEELIRDVDVVVDGTDNLRTRFIINDAAIKLGKPWVFVGFASWYGNVLFINPGKGPCLRCVIPARMVEREERRDACEILGAVGTAIAFIASISSTLVLKHILGILDDYSTFYIVNGKTLDIDKVRVKRNPECPSCVYKKYEFLREDVAVEKATRICGSNAVEVMPPKKIRIDLYKYVEGVDKAKVLSVNPYTAKIKISDMVSMVLFSDGRAIIDGTIDEEYAYRVYKSLVLDRLVNKG